jgi:CHAT domain-containing protein/Flp pilus assembly protein TadD
MNSRPRLYRFYLLTAVVLVLGLGVVLWSVSKTRSEANDGISALRSAYREQRALEPRLSDFNYAPASALRSKHDRVDYVKLDRAGRLLLGAVTEHPSAESHRHVGQYYLATHELEKAIDQFNLALDLDPKNAKAHNDLGTALFEKGRLLTEKSEPDATQAFAASLQHFNQALELDPSLNEAVFNRAFLCKHMKLLSEAEENWKDYLSKDSTSGWATEARDNLNAVQELKRSTSRSRKEIVEDFQSAYAAGDESKAWQIVSSYHNRTGNVVFEELLDSYLESTSENPKGDTSPVLRLLSYIGELADRKAGDKFFRDQALFYSTAPRQRIELLKRGRSQMKSAYDGWGKDQPMASLEKFEEAKKLFERAEDIGEATIASYWICFCRYRDHKTEQGLTTIQPLMSASETHGYKWLTVRQLYLKASLHFDLTNYSQALDLAHQSLKLATQSDDAVGKLNALTLLIEYNRVLSNYDESEQCIQRSLELLDRTTLDPVQGGRHYSFIASSLTAAGWNDAAAAYQKEALRYTYESSRPSLIPYNLAFLSQIQAKLKRFNEAEATARRAVETATAQSDKDQTAYSLVQLGHVYRLAGNLNSAIESYDRAIALYKKLNNYEHQLYPAHKGRLFCYLAQGQNQLAEKETAEAVRLIESYRSRIFEQDNRSSFFDAEQTVYDVAIGFQYSHMKSAERAFEYSESSRARSLVDLINADRRVLTRSRELSVKGASRSLSLSAIKNRMPAEVQVIQYAMLEDELVIWVLAGKQLNSTSVPIKGEELNAKVNAYLRLISSPSTSARDAEEVSNRARELYDKLIAPVESLLVKEKQLCVVPDKILNLLPFGTLVSRASGEYLLNRYELMVSPSSTSLVLFSEMAAHKRLPQEERILSVGNPSFDRTAFPSLPDLSSATREATQVAGLYDSRALLVEKDASVAQVVSELKNADIVHFALHSVLDEKFPMRSKFLLARTDKHDANDSVLFAHDIYDLKLPRVRLAVLSACETGSGRYFGGEGVMNMARPFLSAGVPLVVASLWPVESNATTQLMINFHRFRTEQRLPVAKALKKAQLQMLQDADPRLHDPYYWAPFVLIGGYADF